jgi:glutamate/tyrosine decarboxylase-like PLP-dependent enzyme
MSIDFPRGFRALPAWCALYSIGRAGFENVVEQSLENAGLLRSLIENHQGAELVNRQAQLSHPFCTFAFRIVHPDWDVDQANEAHRAAVELVNASASSYVSGTIR